MASSRGKRVASSLTNDLFSHLGAVVEPVEDTHKLIDVGGGGLGSDLAGEVLDLVVEVESDVVTMGKFGYGVNFIAVELSPGEARNLAIADGALGAE